MSQIQIKPGETIEEKLTTNQLFQDERFFTYGKNGINARYTTFTVLEKTRLFATLNELPGDLDLYIGKVDSEGLPILDRGYPLAYSSSTNPGKESESIFSVLGEGDYWIGVVANVNSGPYNMLSIDNQFKSFEFSLDGKTFDETTKLSDDPLLKRQWHLFDAGIVPDGYFVSLSNQNVDIGAPEAWKLGYNAEIPIAIIDGGVDINHPDLRDNLWTNPNEIAGNGIDDDKNGYTDDIHGWNFADGIANVVPNLHGTHVAGTVGAKGDNGIGVSGVAWNTELMTLDVSGKSGNMTNDAIKNAIYYAVDNGAKVINMSLGGAQKISATDFFDNPENGYQEAFQHAYDNDVFVAIAAANDGAQQTSRNRWDGIGDLDEYVNSPAVNSQIFGNIASVAALNAQGKLAQYSNFGQTASIIAPGGDGAEIYLTTDDNDDAIFVKSDALQILSTVPVGKGNIDNDGTVGTNKDYKYMQGTSMASPVIAGMAGLIRAQNDEITAVDTVAILRAGALKNPELKDVVNQGYQANLYGSLEIAQRWEGPDTLTGIGQDIAPVINLSSLTTAQTLSGSLELTRDASLDPVIGFYKVLDENGTIMDANGNALKPGDANYQSVALNTNNLIEGLNNLELENDSSRSLDYSFKGSTNGFYLAPFAITADNTWFAWKEANSDGLDHFKVLGANKFGLDDQAGPDADKDFQDVVMNFTSSEII